MAMMTVGDWERCSEAHAGLCGSSAEEQMFGREFRENYVSHSSKNSG
jgi:hypothetical protein